MKQIERDGATINYQVAGNGDVALLFVHGSYIDQSYWDKQVQYFSPHYKVVTLDLPGQGKSGRDRKRWTMQGFADDVNGLVKQLNLRHVILIGHSMGGDINLIAATDNPEPVIGFIAVDIFKNAATPLPPEYQGQVAAIKENLKKDFVTTNEQYARMVLLTPQTPQAIVDKVIQDYRNAYEPMGQQIIPEIFDMYITEQKLLPKLNIKMFIVNVDYIPINEEPLKKYVPGGYEVLHMKGTSHFPMLENPGELNKQLEQAINSILNKRS